MAEQQRSYTVLVRETIEFAVQVTAEDAGAAGEEAVALLMDGGGRKNVEWASADVSAVQTDDIELNVTAFYDWNQRSDDGLPGRRMFAISDGKLDSHGRLALADSPYVALARAERERELDRMDADATG